MQNAAMRVEAPVMAILRTLSKTMKARERSLTIMLITEASDGLTQEGLARLNLTASIS